MSVDSIPLSLSRSARSRRPGGAGLRARVASVVARPELLLVLLVAAGLNLWNLSINGVANTYHAATVRAMASSWHDFLFNAMDRSGLMTVDKPPLSDWIQALSVRVFGWSSWSLLAPQAVMGIIAAGLTYDLTRRRFGRIAGFVAGIVMATTPTIVAVSRHNNPDELLVLLSVAAVWFALRALDTGRTKWLVWSGVMVGLGFETKMGVALMLVPGIATAWVWTRWQRNGGVRANLRMFGQLLWGGLALAVVGLAWPIMVTLTPAADRPWISGTADNSVWSLIFGYNGVGRIAGQSGGPGGGGGIGGQNALFGGSTGIFRLVGSSLGSQAGWLLGFAIVSAIALLVMTRLRRDDPRTGFLLVIGVTLLVVGAVFSFASGIFHPYYVSMLAPWVAILIGAGVGEMLPAPYGVARSSLTARIIGPAAIAAGAITELIVLHEINGDLSWGTPVVVATAIVACILLAVGLSPRLRLAVAAVAIVALLAAPATWATETLGHATSGTFPIGGPANAESGGFGGGPGGGFAGGRGRFGGGAPGGSSVHGRGFAPPAGGASGVVSQLFGQSGAGSSAGTAALGGGFSRSTGFPGGGFGGAGGGFGAGNGELDAAASYADGHGGGVVAVESQSTAAQSILDGHDNVAGIGGFSGRESTVTAAWIAEMVKEGRLRYILGDNAQFAGPSDGRTGSASAISIAESVATKVTFTYDAQKVTMYDLHGKSAAILAAAARDKVS
jgi:4-amino-4-deoxy-L-arabinose transferase-like glycosyltransferase